MTGASIPAGISAHVGEQPYRLSNSEHRSWTRCPRKWMLSYRHGLARREEEVGTVLTIGNRVHAALAELYTPGGPRHDPVQIIRDSIAADLARLPTREDDLLKEQDLCVIMIEGYVQWLEEDAPDAELHVISAETALEVPLDDGRTSLLSKIDTRVWRESDNTVLALEHKTVGDLSAPIQSLQSDTQLLTEHLVEYIHQRDGGGEGRRADGVLYNMLRKVKRTNRAKPPFYGREEVRHNSEELTSHWYHVMSIADNIHKAHERLSAGENHHSVCPPSPTKDCRWDCPYVRICPMFDDGSDVAGAIEALYYEVNPLERYVDVEVASLVKQAGVGSST